MDIGKMMQATFRQATSVVMHAISMYSGVVGAVMLLGEALQACESNSALKQELEEFRLEELSVGQTPAWAVTLGAFCVCYITHKIATWAVPLIPRREIVWFRPRHVAAEPGPRGVDNIRPPGIQLVCAGG